MQQPLLHGVGPRVKVEVGVGVIVRVDVFVGVLVGVLVGVFVDVLVGVSCAQAVRAQRRNRVRKSSNTRRLPFT